MIPTHDFVFAAYGNDPRAMALHDELALALVRDELAIAVPSLVAARGPSGLARDHDLARYAGTYRSNQLRVDVRVVGDQLEETPAFEPLDATQRRIFESFAGGAFPATSRRLRPDPRGPVRPGRRAAPRLRRLRARAARPRSTARRAIVAPEAG